MLNPNIIIYTYIALFKEHSALQNNWQKWSKTKVQQNTLHLYKCVISKRLKTGTETTSLSWIVNSFPKEWSPALFLECGTKSLVVSDEERNLGLFSIVWESLNKVMRSHKYDGATFITHLYTYGIILKHIRQIFEKVWLVCSGYQC